MLESPSNPLIAGAAIIAGLVVLRLQAWRALVFLSPRSVRVEAEEPGDVVTVPGALERSWNSLRTLGFSLLGTHSEKPVLAKATLFYDAAQAGSKVYASLFVGSSGSAQLMFFTPTAQGGVVTTDFRRPAREVPGSYLAGAIEGATPERLLKVHLRRVEELGGESSFEPTLEGRVRCARAWYAGPGGFELRLLHAVGLLWAGGGLALVAGALAKLLR